MDNIWNAIADLFLKSKEVAWGNRTGRETENIRECKLQILRRGSSDTVETQRDCRNQKSLPWRTILWWGIQIWRNSDWPGERGAQLLASSLGRSRSSFHRHSIHQDLEFFRNLIRTLRTTAIMLDMLLWTISEGLDSLPCRYTKVDAWTVWVRMRPHVYKYPTILAEPQGFPLTTKISHQPCLISS